MSVEPARLRESPWRLLKNAAGTPRDLANKLGRLARAVSAYADGASLDARLERLVRLGYVQTPPSRLQLVVGSADMLRFWISPAAADYYRSKGIDFGFHQVLRFLDDPASMVDPTGFLSSVDVIVGHVLQVVHANPAYDLQLLESHEDGLEELERQTRAMLEGTHPRQASIGAIVEDPGYHARLLTYVQAYRDDPDAALAPIRDNVANDPYWARVERTFGTLPAAMRYFAKMPSTPLGAARHLLFVRKFPEQLAEPSA
ncbi:MAG: hypothetical protein H6721_04705 [Sandaracinus sp.]|nr:hypothetical protein [Sandaracinus sp.]MCB9619253.1 hypothetical protein [Sandaracinus sp.]MCB9625130.1 hypothetical protein [Sandaracinus sp.]MCB9631427.1 hypothetical protein [Sandaracinus sp.]